MRVRYEEKCFSWRTFFWKIYYREISGFLLIFIRPIDDTQAKLIIPKAFVYSLDKCYRMYNGGDEGCGGGWRWCMLEGGPVGGQNQFSITIDPKEKKEHFDTYPNDQIAASNIRRKRVPFWKFNLFPSRRRCTFHSGFGVFGSCWKHTLREKTNYHSSSSHCKNVFFFIYGVSIHWKISAGK